MGGLKKDFIYFKYPLNIDRILRELKTKPSEYWENIKEKIVLAVFRKASLHCKAYKDFLKINKINPEKIKTIQDFDLLPPTNKENYINYYPLEWLVYEEDFKKPKTIHATSGSTGEPSYFTRDSDNDLRRSIILNYFLTNSTIDLQKPILFIITFGMGVWSAGIGIFSAAYLLNNFKKYPISIISPGVNILEVLKIFSKLTNNYNQIVICGYPPFIKDIIDMINDNKELKRKLEKINLYFIFTGEGIPEEFRDYIQSKIKIKNILRDTMNTYGTSEAGATGIETPLSILIRRVVRNKKDVLLDLFGEKDRIPSLVQYIPYFVNIFEKNKELFLTVDNVLPLVNYQIGDIGGVLTYKNIKEILANHNLNLEKLIRKHKIYKYIYKLPFVYVFERKNMATTLYGILIYPEFIKSALFKSPLPKFLTGKFVMKTKFDKKQNQYLEIILELKSNLKKIDPKYTKIILETIIRTLRERSSEYRELSNNLKEKVYPKIKFLPFETKGVFDLKSKHKWKRE